MAPDLWTGDVVDVVAASVTPGFPIPSPLSTLTLTSNGAGKGDPTAYTVQAPDVGANFLVTQASANSQGTVSATTATRVPIAPVKAWDQTLLGANCAGPQYYTVVQFLNNAAQSGQYLNNAAGTAAYAGGLDANGWPTSAFSFLVTAQIGGRDGQLPAGTYACSYRSVGQTSVVTGTGCTVTITSQDPDGVTTHFTMVVPFGANAKLFFSGGVQYVDIPRDGVTPTYGGPEFWGVDLAHFSQFTILRMMDLCGVNFSTEKKWSDRNLARPEYSPTQPTQVASGTLGNIYSWERNLRLAKAFVQYPGSKVKKIWINPPGEIDTTQAQADNYAYQLPTLMNTMLAGVTVDVDVEPGNEPWNVGAFPLGGHNQVTAGAETQALLWYSGFSTPIVSIVGDGAGNVTVTLSTPCNAVTLLDGTTFAITNGMAMIANHQQANSTWGAGSIVPDPNAVNPGVMTSVTVTVPSPTGTTFTYHANGTPSGTLGAASSNSMAFFFGLTSSLLTGGFTMNFFDLGTFVMVRRAFQIQQIWSTVRPQDKFKLGFQKTYNTSVLPFVKYIGGGSTAWCNDAAIAPYVVATGLPFASATSGNSFVAGISWATSAQVGDQVKIRGAGASGADLTTTVVAGSSGTTLNIADAISTTVTNGLADYVSCASAAFTGSISGTTLTVSAVSAGPILAGMYWNGTVAVAFNTKITRQLTGTAGSTGTYEVSIAQNVTSQAMVAAQTDGLCTAMLSEIPSFAASLLTHIYNCLKWGIRPTVYEGGPGTETFATQQMAIHQNSILGTVVTQLFDAWFNQGGQEFCAFHAAPGVISNATEGAWPFLQSYTDTSAPKFAALVAYANRPLAYSNIFGGGYGPTGTGPYAQTPACLLTNLFLNATNGMLYNSNALDRRVEIVQTIARTRRYQFSVKGSDTVATLVDCYVDNVLVGQIALPANGSGSVNVTVPGDGTPIPLGDVTRGAHLVAIDFPAGRGNVAGVFSFGLTRY